MKPANSLPFKVGQRVEARSFVSGYRGAWFRCEIKEICRRKGFGLDYYDYPDQKLTWMRSAYQNLPGRKKRRDIKFLMLRPHYPRVYIEGEAVPDINALSETIVVRDGGAWKVGDSVEWLNEGAYWSGTITEIKGEDKIEVQLPPRPAGEGSSYEAFTKDLRPSLDWSLESGWTLPADENGHVCARLVQPGGHDSVDVTTKDNAEVIELEIDVSSSSCSSDLPTLENLHSKEEENQSIPRCPAIEKERPDEAPEEDKASNKAVGWSSGAKTRSYADIVSSIDNVQDSTGVDCDDDLENVEGASSANCSSKRTRRNEYIPSPPKSPSDDDDSIVSMLIDLEELLCDIKCVQRMLNSPEESTDGTEWESLHTTSPSK